MKRGQILGNWNEDQDRWQSIWLRVVAPKKRKSLSTADGEQVEKEAKIPENILAELRTAGHEVDSSDLMLPLHLRGVTATALATLEPRFVRIPSKKF